MLVARDVLVKPRADIATEGCMFNDPAAAVVGAGTAGLGTGAERVPLGNLTVNRAWAAVARSRLQEGGADLAAVFEIYEELTGTSLRARDRTAGERASAVIRPLADLAIDRTCKAVAWAGLAGITAGFASGDRHLAIGSSK